MSPKYPNYRNLCRIKYFSGNFNFKYIVDGRTSLNLLSFIQWCPVFLAKEDHDLHAVAMDATAKLKNALTNERECRLKIQAEKELLQVSNIVVHV